MALFIRQSNGENRTVLRREKGQLSVQQQGITTTVIGKSANVRVPGRNKAPAPSKQVNNAAGCVLPFTTLTQINSQKSQHYELLSGQQIHSHKTYPVKNAVPLLVLKIEDLVY